MSHRLVVVGDALLDVDLDGIADRLAPDAPAPVVESIVERPRPGGAGLAAALLAGMGHDVTLICALGPDEAGERVAALLAGAGVAVCDLGAEATPEKVRVRAGERALVRLDRGGSGGPCGPMGSEGLARLHAADAVLVSDYGRGVAAEPTVRAALEEIPGGVPLVWDPHPKGPAPIPGVVLATPNAKEATGFTGEGRPEPAARALAARWGAVNVCVTLGAGGALLVGGSGRAQQIPAPRVTGGDACGAGDCFATAATAALAAGALPAEAVDAAVRAAARFVAAGGAAGAAASGFGQAPGGARALAARVRAAGGTVVATGGCFDLLHAGHVSMLQAARALGDCLIVCMNSDASVGRLKGSDRPLVSEHDRVAVLEALACVDAVAVFEEDDPRAVLRELRPHVWVKGGDYAVAEMPEAATLAEWDGRTAIVPYMPGRSTSRLLEEAVSRVA
jgi:D-beta-D-heptose 7-phosphate kinase/D-beta-D-heptose 1-phosphate adenosyltransferase